MAFAIFKVTESFKEENRFDTLKIEEVSIAYKYKEVALEYLYDEYVSYKSFDSCVWEPNHKDSFHLKQKNWITGDFDTVTFFVSRVYKDKSLKTLCVAEDYARQKGFML
jgi:hypothetical protein